MIPIRYQQLVLFPCCAGSKEINPNIIHIFGLLQSESKEDKDLLQHICKNTQARMHWKASLASDQVYSYLPYEKFEWIDHRKYIYKKWKKYIPIKDISLEETCSYLEMKISVSNRDIMFLCWMYNVIISTKQIARSYTECISSWCDYIRLDCPCSPWIPNFLSTHTLSYVPYDKWIIIYKEDFIKHNIRNWKSFCEKYIKSCYDTIKKDNSNRENQLFYMVTLPILWEILHEELRMVKQIFVEDAVHPYVIRTVQDWVGQFGCILCCSYESNHIPTSIDYWKNTIIPVSKIHNHLRIKIENDIPVITNEVYPTLENIDKVMEIMPDFMYDYHEIIFEIFSDEDSICHWIL